MHNGPFADQGSDKLDKILAAIEHTHESLVSKIDSVAVGLNLLRDDHRKLADRVSHSEKDIVELKLTVTGVQTILNDLTDRVRYLEGRAEEAEGRNRRSNLRIVGLPENEEGSDPLGFLEDWIRPLCPGIRSPRSSQSSGLIEFQGSLPRLEPHLVRF